MKIFTIHRKFNYFILLYLFFYILIIYFYEFKRHIAEEKQRQKP